MINPFEKEDIRSCDKSVPKTIFFKYNSTEYSYEIFSSKQDPYEIEYQAMKKFLDNNPNILIEIHGYQNQMERKSLAGKRALKVKRDLLRIGIEATNLTTIEEPAIIVSDTIKKFDKELTQKVEFKLRVKK